ncbi:MAG: PilN domain-containing protein, partial [Gammaproteobacteria bacterium]|nr:PilN domain-containing protein [Gammaproteobacteria bacterium]
RLCGALAVCALALAAVAAYLPLQQKQHTLAELENRLAETRAAALEADSLKTRLEEAIEKSRFLVERKRARPGTVALVDEMSRIVPDNTWLLQLGLDDERLTMAGYS